MSEKSMLQGSCQYCGNEMLVEMRLGATLEEVTEEATRQCDYSGARSARAREAQRIKCIEEIEIILGEKYPDIADMFIESVQKIQGMKIEKITINADGNVVARMKRTKDGIKVELEQKKKVEGMA